MVDSPTFHQVGTAAGEFNVRDLLCGIVRSCCHLVGADFCALCVTGLEIEACFPADDNSGRRLLSLEVPVYVMGKIEGRLGFGWLHDRTGHDDRSATVATGLAVVIGNVVQLAGALRRFDGYELADVVVRDLFKLGFDLHQHLGAGGADRAAVTTTITMIGQSIHQIQAVVLGG